MMRRSVLAVLSIAMLTAGCGSGGAGQDAATNSVAPGSDPAAASGESTATDDSAAMTDDGGDSTTAGDGCDLISDEVAASVLGVDIIRREPGEDPTTGGVTCTKGNELGTFVNISRTPGAGPTFLDQAMGEAGYEPVPGVGDRAAFVANGGSLLIAVGADLITVQVDRGGTPGSLDDCLTLADDVLSNL